ncbi:MAG: 50S ribosomal protein L29 [Planctomycetota bacterium]
MVVILAKNLREKTTQELRDQLMLEKKRIFDGVVKNASGEAIKSHEKRLGRRLIARIQCILRERELRTALSTQIAELTPKAEKAGQQFVKMIRNVEQRAADIKSALEKSPAADRSRKVKPMIKRVRMKDLPISSQEVTPSDRAALALAEAKRRWAALDRVDIGQG